MSKFDSGKKLSEKKMKSRTTCEGNFLPYEKLIFPTLCRTTPLNSLEIYII
jgi:hypothetical protein